VILRRKFEDTKGVIRSCKSKKDRKYNGQKKKDKRTNNHLLNTTQQTKDRATWTPLKYQEWQAVPAPHMAPVVLLLLQNTTQKTKDWLTLPGRVEINRNTFGGISVGIQSKSCSVPGKYNIYHLLQITIKPV